MNFWNSQPSLCCRMSYFQHCSAGPQTTSELCLLIRIGIWGSWVLHCPGQAFVALGVLWSLTNDALAETNTWSCSFSCWTQSVSSSRWLFVKQGFQSQPQFTETCTCTCLIWKYGKDLESQNVNSATRATSNTYIRCGFECKDFTLLSWLKKSPSDFFLKAEEMIKSNLFALSNIQNTKDLRILKFLRLEKTFKMTKSKYQPSTTTMSTVKPCLHVLCPDVACISQTRSGFGESSVVAI